jgi:integrase/recombinase XerD
MEQRMIEEFRADLKTRRLSRDTQLQYPGYVKALSVFNNGDLLGVTDDVLVAYLDHLQSKDLALSSIRRHFAGLGGFYDFLMFKKQIAANPVSSMFKKRYLHEYKTHDTSQRRKCISVDEARLLVESIMNIREKVVVVVLFKTGIRRRELSTLDITDLDMQNMVIHLKPTAKRSNLDVFYDQETKVVLEKWLKRRKDTDPALFHNNRGHRFKPNSINAMFKKYATACGLNDPNSKKLEDKMTPHCCRHWYSTFLLQNGMKREEVMELRGDSAHDSVDLYNHIDKNKLKDHYLACIPQLGL